jgi:multicomponent Na+:H+ antiporter subunit F
MFVIAAIGILTTMLLALARAILGPSAYDRILAVNMIGTKTMLLIAVAGFLTGRPELLDLTDLALLYGLVSYVAVLAVLRFSKYGDLGSDEQVRR